MNTVKLVLTLIGCTQALTIQATSGLRLPVPKYRNIPMLKKQSIQNLIFLARMAPFSKMTRRHTRQDPAEETSTPSTLEVLANWDRFKASVQRLHMQGKNTTSDNPRKPLSLLNGLATPKLFIVGSNRIVYAPHLQTTKSYHRLSTKFPFKKYRGG